MRTGYRVKFLIISLMLIVALFLVGGLAASDHQSANASQADAYDLSEWQGQINDQKARRLKNEVSFVILRAQYGSSYQDRQFQNSANEMNKNNIPYGVYSYSLYHNNQQARNEAASLYNLAPRANFYVNDIEQNNAGRRINSATVAWANEMKQLTSRPVILYSYSNFIDRYLLRAKNHYDGLWLANYSSRQPAPGYKYDLWQYSSKHYSRALGKKIDASMIMSGKPQFWINNNGTTDVVSPVKQVVRPKTVRKSVKYRGVRMNRYQLRKYHHEMEKIGRKLMRGYHRFSRSEKQALKIYQSRHGHAYRV